MVIITKVLILNFNYENLIELLIIWLLSIAKEIRYGYRVLND